MAEFKVIKADTREEKTAPQRIESFLVAYRVVILSVIGALLCAAVALAVVSGLSASRRKAGLGKVDAVSAALAAADEEGYPAAAEKALADLEPLSGSRNILGARANMLRAEIFFRDKRWADARDAWLKAAGAAKSSYLAPLCWYNAAVACEELGENEDAASYYGQAGAVENFTLRTHALFNAGRVKDETGDYEGAAKSYQELADSHTGDSWANIAMTRLIALRAEGKIQ